MEKKGINNSQYDSHVILEIIIIINIINSTNLLVFISCCNSASQRRLSRIYPYPVAVVEVEVLKENEELVSSDLRKYPCLHIHHFALLFYTKQLAKFLKTSLTKQKHYFLFFKKL